MIQISKAIVAILIQTLLLIVLQNNVIAVALPIRDFVSAMDDVQSTRKAQHNLQQSLFQAAIRRRRLGNEDDDAAIDSYSTIDLTKYAFKYIGCSNVHTWSDDQAVSSESPFRLDKFVVFRLCEASSCSTYNKWGCNYNYGEYLVPMETYLELMHLHHVSQFGYYCRICSQCMTYKSNVQSSYNDDDGQDDWASYSDYWATHDDDVANGDDAANANDNVADDGAADDYYADDVAADDDAYNYNQRNRKTANNDDASATPFYISSNGTCIYESVCSRYKNACANAPTRSDIQQYFTCQKFNIGSNGNVGFLGPHCRSDGRTIDIGFYADEYCNKFLGETQNTNIKNYLNIQTSDMDAYTSKSCVPCQASNAFSLLTDNQLAADNGTRVYSLCDALYDPAAKCQKAFVDRKDSYESTEQLDNEDAVCGMIESLVTNSYDEFGDPIVLEDFDYHRWTKGSEYVKLVRKATTFQIVALVGSILLSLGLFVYAANLHRRLVIRAPWVPPSVSGYYNHFDGKSQAGRMSRGDSFTRGGSGILANRTGMSFGESSQTGGQPSPRAGVMA
ncbi:hypothetical protein MPSEU_000360900 [Mayamaea pseudoterrestris]|nr:hypothetical protein MPSEU_000360900 [Mayamaea pseudoterrestris]